ncbi:MAG: antibiotic biosynthesis monooxygenase [Flavobacteriaceae bacterium]
MKTSNVRAFVWMLLVSTLVLIGCESAGNDPDKNTTQNTIIVLTFKTQPEKGSRTVSELTNLIEKVKLEPNFKGIKLHVDPKDNTNILLYEEWEDANYYNTTHMETAHMKEFMVNSRNFLTGPPEITFWKIEKEFK